MSGTRHEKIAIAVVSYVIGFTTAFIAFGVNKIDSNSKEGMYVEQATHKGELNAVEKTVITDVNQNDEGLFAVTSWYERLLAANRQSANVIAGAVAPGFYYNVVGAQASKNGQYIYYCEQLSKEAATCDPYVYELESDVLYPVKKNGVLVRPDVSKHVSSWTNEDRLLLNGSISLDASSPWNLREGQE